MIAVVVAVGPYEANRRWLRDCLGSLEEQSLRPAQVVLVDDSGERSLEVGRFHLPITVWHSPWNLGVAHAYNCGVGLAMTELVFMLGSDDTLEPNCLERCYAKYNEVRDAYGYYSVSVRYMDTGEVQTAPCHAAMVTRTLWRHTGGFPIASASGAPDAAFLSILYGRGAEAGRVWWVDEGEPLYNYRRHKETDTARKADWQRVILETRHLVTLEWEPRSVRA